MMSFIPVQRLTIQEYSSNESNATRYVSWPTPPELRYDIDEQACISTWHKRDAVEQQDVNEDPHQPVPSDKSPFQPYESSR